MHFLTISVAFLASGDYEGGMKTDPQESVTDNHFKELGLRSILAITTSHRNGSIAFWREGVQTSCHLEGTATESIHVSLDRIEQEQSRNTSPPGSSVPSKPWSWQDLDLIVWDVGPGSFTGLRAAQSVVKTFSYLLSTPVYAVSSFEVIAKSLPLGRQVICRNAYQQTVFLSRVENQVLVDPILNFKISQIPQEYFLHSPHWVGDGVALVPRPQVFQPSAQSGAQVQTQRETTNNLSSIQTGEGPSKVVDSGAAMNPSAEILIRLGLNSKISQWTKDWKTISPLYLRGSAAEELRAKG